MTEYLKTHDTSTKEGMKAAVDVAYALATKYGEGAAALSCEMYDAVAELSGVTVPMAEPADTATYEDAAKTVYGIMKHSDKPEAVGSGVGRLVKMAGVDTTIKNGMRDGAQFAWIPHGDTCAFCLMLASNGWRNISKKALKNGHAEHIHNNCDCTYMVRFDDKTTVAGYDPEKYKAMYDNAEGDTWEDKVNSIRREQYKARRAVENADEGDIIETGRATTQSIWDALKEYGVINYPVAALSEPLTEEQIIAKLHGTDRGGHCSSLAFAYIGNKHGLDVSDFRNDASEKIFWRTKSVQDITRLAGGFIEKDNSDYAAVGRLVKNVEKGKEYVLSTGKHTAIIRKAKRGYEYLELQHNLDYGFKKLNNTVLKDRFKCVKKSQYYNSSMLFDIDLLKDNETFKELLGYINNNPKGR